MNYNPQNESGLLGLVAALKAGMDPSTAQSLFSGIQQDQGAQIAQRQQKLSGLADLLSQNAQQGLPYAGAEALMNAQPGPAGPAAQNILSSLYPTQDAPLPSNLQPGNNPDWQAGTPMPAPIQQATQGQAQSPAYTPDPMATLQLQEQQAQTFQATQAANFSSEWPIFQQDMTRFRAKGTNPYDALAQFTALDPANAALIASDGGKTAIGIMKAIWGDQALAMAGVPTQ